MPYRIDHKVAKRSRAEREHALLLRSGAALGAAKDVPGAASALADIAVPELGDWCFVDFLEETNVNRLALVHADPERVAHARSIGERFPLDPEARFGPVPAIRARTTDLVADIPLVVRQALPEACGLSRVVAQLGIHSRVVVPLAGLDGVVHGALTFAWAETRRTYSAADLPLLEELGRQLGLVVDSLRLREALEGGPAGKAKQKLACLSPRERQVLDLVAAGLSTREIAVRLGLGARTVETHRVHVLRKLGLKGAVDVVRFAARCGLIADPQEPAADSAHVRSVAER